VLRSYCQFKGRHPIFPNNAQALQDEAITKLFQGRDGRGLQVTAVFWFWMPLTLESQSNALRGQP
jgi:hypothetical protein